MSSISIQNLSIAYQNLRVIDGLNLEIGKGEFVVLLGPSGCGKSTLLGAIAGLTDVSDGGISIGARDVTYADPSARGLAMVFQSYALYPNMTVRGNLSYGLRVAKVAKPEIERRVDETARFLQITDYLDRKPAQLSGGQRQRVAIGRAIIREVDVFLFDEPLSNLDAKLRGELRVEIKRLHRDLKSTIVYVTHDQVEALTLADRIAVMKGGVIQQFAPPSEIYRRPVNRFVASFIGSPTMNFLDGTIEGEGDAAQFIGDGVRFPLAGYAAGTPLRSGKATLGFRPEHVVLADGAHPGTIRADVDLIEPMGGETIIWAKAGPTTVAIKGDDKLQSVAGGGIWMQVDPARVSLFDEAGDRL